MDKVKVWKPSEAEIKEAMDWPTWEKEPSVFNWYYSEDETFYVVEGDVEVTLDDGTKVSFSAGDMVLFKKGVRCTWNVKERIFKHYKL